MAIEIIKTIMMMKMFDQKR